MFSLNVLNHFKGYEFHVVLHARLYAPKTLQKDQPAALVVRGTSLILNVCKVYLCWGLHVLV